MALQRNDSIVGEAEVTLQSKKIMQVIEEAWRMVPELAIPEEETVEVLIRKLASGMHDTRTEMVRVQLELNLYIIELHLRAQRSTLSEVKEQWKATITEAVATVESTVADCMQLLEQSFEVLTSL